MNLKVKSCHNNVIMSGNMSLIENNRIPNEKNEENLHIPIQNLDKEDFNRY